MPMPCSIASRGLRRRERLALPAHLAAIGLDESGEDLQQRRLAGAVLADQRVRLALGDVEADAAERVDGAERFLGCGRTAGSRAKDDSLQAPMTP